MMSGFNTSISLISTPPFAVLTSSFAPWRLQLLMLGQLIEWQPTFDHVVLECLGKPILVGRLEFRSAAERRWWGRPLSLC